MDVRSPFDIPVSDDEIEALEALLADREQAREAAAEALFEPDRPRR